MNKIKFQILSIIQKLRSNVSILLTIGLALLIIFEIFVIKRAVTTVLDIAHANPPVEASALVRVNFSNYDKIVKKIESAPQYIPNATVTSNPFGINSPSKPK